MVGKRVAVALMMLITRDAWAATERPVVEIHPVVDCKGNPESLPLTVPRYPSGQCVSGDVIIGGADVIQARHTKSVAGEDMLNITLSANGRQRLLQFTLNHVRDGIATVIDGRTVGAAIIREPIISYTLEITGELSGTEIDALVERFQLQPSN